MPPRVHGSSRCDASGEPVEVPRRPGRIVSLVPSVTETLFALGLGERIAGVTEWCIHPADRVATIAKVRGTKNPDLDAIAELRPDLVLANLEENRAVDVRRMRERGLCVWVDYPRTVDEAVVQVRFLSGLGATDAATHAVMEPIEQAIAQARRSLTAEPGQAVRGFVAVWKDPWMTISRDTYAYDLLRTAGIESVLADGRGRYPRVTLDEVAGVDPEVVLLPDEPYRFTDDDARALAAGPLAATRAARHGRIRVIDGTLPFWHGPRIVPALDLLRALIEAVRRESRAGSR
jgi:ABC-type Fe3+-hydroxamate transport system substrate-binding protein